MVFKVVFIVVIASSLHNTPDGTDLSRLAIGGRVRSMPSFSKRQYQNTLVASNCFDGAQGIYPPPRLLLPLVRLLLPLLVVVDDGLPLTLQRQVERERSDPTCHECIPSACPANCPARDAPAWMVQLPPTARSTDDMTSR